MSGEASITIVGNLGDNPELKYTPNGEAVCNLSVAYSTREYDKQTQEWKDSPTLWIRATAWRGLAENVAASLVKGDRVIVTGTMKPRAYTTKDGEPRTVWELRVTGIGPDLAYAHARAIRQDRQGGGQQAAPSPNTGQGGQRSQTGQWGGQQGGQGGSEWGEPGAPLY